jgi:3-(3-hydroxy-phenyl)propionate hydroxylase
LPADVLASAAQWRAKGLPLKITCITHGGDADAGPQASPADAPWQQVLSDPQGRAYSRYGVTAPGSAYLLRPDQHSCARWLCLDAQRLDAALEQATSGEAP